jgi:hypothetical protein
MFFYVSLDFSLTYIFQNDETDKTIKVCAARITEQQIGSSDVHTLSQPILFLFFILCLFFSLLHEEGLIVAWLQNKSGVQWIGR